MKEIYVSKEYTKRLRNPDMPKIKPTLVIFKLTAQTARIFAQFGRPGGQFSSYFIDV
jgi:hypothetical protein